MLSNDPLAVENLCVYEDLKPWVYLNTNFILRAKVN